MSPARGRAPVEHFERLARASNDPWEYSTSPYEQAKYRRTLAHLPERIGSALELGCSVGVFTAMLAPRCERLLAVDFSPTALAHARERLGDLDGVELRQAVLPEETPGGPFAAIVCSEILYYWDPGLVREGLRRIEAALAPGGTLVAVHWRPGDPRRELDGDAVHAILREEAGLLHRGRESNDDFLLDSWVRAEAPAEALRAAVVVPARDEEARIGACLDSLAAQDGLRPEEYEVIVVVDGCTDATAAAVAAAGERWPGLRLRPIAGPGRGAGPARAAGMDLACALLESGGAGGLLASTDADTVVAPDWLRRQLEAIAAGAEAVGGEIVLDPGEVAALPAEVLERRSREIAERVRGAARRGPAEHAHFSGASLGITAGAYRRVGGMGRLAALEDQELEDRLAAAGIAIHRPRSVRVTTAARTDGRAERGLARDLELGRWLATRRYRAEDFGVEDLLATKRGEIAAILPARECAATIGPTIEALSPLRQAGLLDRLLVIDAESADGSGEIAAAAGAEVLAESSLCPELGPCRGKGDAMWRAARAVEADVLVFLDADSRDFRPAFLTGLLGPLLLETGVDLVKGTFERPFSLGASVRDGEGGRVTELVARPLLNLHFPALAGFAQPLAGEVAIRRDLFARMSVPVGYGVEVAMMVDALRLVGLDAMAEVDLGTRLNSHQDLRALSLMAAEVMVAVERRTGAPPRPDSPGFRPRPEGAGAEVWRLRCEERPPLRGLARPPATPGRSA